MCPCARACTPSTPSIVCAHRDGLTSPSHGFAQVGASCDVDRCCCSRQLLRFRSQRATSSKLVSTRDKSSVPVLVGVSLGQALLVTRPRRLVGDRLRGTRSSLASRTEMRCGSACSSYTVPHALRIIYAWHRYSYMFVSIAPRTRSPARVLLRRSRARKAWPIHGRASRHTGVPLAAATRRQRWAASSAVHPADFTPPHSECACGTRRNEIACFTTFVRCSTTSAALSTIARPKAAQS